MDGLEITYGGVLLVGALLLWRFHVKRPEFDLADLLTDKDTNRLSLSRFGQLVALVTSTWAVSYQVIHNTLTEWLFTAYMAVWAGAQGMSLWFKTKGGNNNEVR